jgi:enoyl-CoA hydratase/carnithine racemase
MIPEKAQHTPNAHTTAGQSPDTTMVKQIILTRRSPAYWRVAFDHPPLNSFGPETIPQLNEIITALEIDEQVKVVVFGSAVDGFFLTHYNFLAKLEDSTRLPAGQTGLQPLPDMLVRLSRCPIVSIVFIRGRSTGMGSELALASDMRFASREKAILSQWEVGAGLVPGGGPMARLPRLIGRGRALEALLGADDIGGDLAELYGYVNRSLPDAELDAFVDALATRISSFDKQAIAETKRLVKPGDVETRLGFHVGLLGVPNESAPPDTQITKVTRSLPHMRTNRSHNMERNQETTIVKHIGL